MKASAFDTVTRRASLLTLGGAAMAAGVMTPAVSGAKKKKSCGKKQQKKCNQNKSACIAQFTTACENDPECIAAFTPCCDECFSNGFLTCFLLASD